jgi:glutaminyl-peptide cyclotransferase
VNRWNVGAVLFLGAFAAACDAATPSETFEVVHAYPHDPAAYTQGLVFFEGNLYESTGKNGESTVRRVDVETGEVTLSTALPDEHFGEGLALVGSELYQLTWKAGLAYVYGLDSLEVRRTFSYDGEGWGLCYDGQVLYMSNGSDRLQQRDPRTFELLGDLRVTEGGFSVFQLNELECVGEHILANVFMTNRIVRIDKATGEVVSELDAYSLSLASRRPPNAEAVFNGIAWDPGTDHLYVTGKLWPDLFEIRVDRP